MWNVETWRSETQQHRRPVEPGAEGGEKDQVARFDSALIPSLAEAEGNRCRSGVAVAVDVDEHDVVGSAERLLNCVDDPEVRLVWHHQREIGNSDAGLIEDFSGGRDHPEDGFSEDLAPLHDDLFVFAPAGALEAERESGTAHFEAEDPGL